MKGHIRERHPGAGQSSSTARPPDREAQAQMALIQGDKARSADECARLISAIQGGTYLEPSKTTLAQFFERWLDHMKVAGVAPSTRAIASWCERTSFLCLGSVISQAKARPYIRGISKALTADAGRKGRLVAQTVSICTGSSGGRTGSELKC